MLINERPPRLKAIKGYLRQFSFVVSMKRSAWKILGLERPDLATGTTKLNVLETFPLFAPFSQGGYKEKAILTVEAINQTMPLLSSFAATIAAATLPISDIDDVPPSERAAVAQLKVYLDRHGSDKANHHNYHLLYGSIFNKPDEVTGVLEIGLGTDNVDVVSNMGSGGKPGASLRAFRDFFGNANIYGADVDKRVLFTENRINTFFVDQTDSTTFELLGKSIPGELDLVIDDGLHSPNANIATLRFGLAKVRPGGWVVIEDISPDAKSLWEVVSALVPQTFERRLLKATKGYIFAVRRPR